MAEVIPIRQNLYWASSQGRFVCAQCNDGNHRWCEHCKCNCAHLDPPLKPRPKPVRDRNGLTLEELAAQIDFPFEADEPLEV